MAQAVNLVVNGTIFLNISVATCDVGFRLVIIKVRNKIMHLVIWKKLTKLRVKLRGQGFVVRQHKGRFLHVLNQIRHGKSLTGAGHTQQSLLANTLVQPIAKLCNSLRLVTGGRVFAFEFKLWHNSIIPCIDFLRNLCYNKGMWSQTARILL